MKIIYLADDSSGRAERPLLCGDCLLGARAVSVVGVAHALHAADAAASFVAKAKIGKENKIILSCPFLL